MHYNVAMIGFSKDNRLSCNLFNFVMKRVVRKEGILCNNTSWRNGLKVFKAFIYLGLAVIINNNVHLKAKHRVIDVCHYCYDCKSQLRMSVFSLVIRLFSMSFSKTQKLRRSCETIKMYWKYSRDCTHH